MRQDDTLHVSLVLPHGPKAPHETRFPEPIEAHDGFISLPPFDSVLIPDPELVDGEVEVDWDQLITAKKRNEAEDKARHNQMAGAARIYLRDTDWYVTRQIETGADIPEDMAQKRRVARTVAGGF